MYYTKEAGFSFPFTVKGGPKHMRRCEMLRSRVSGLRRVFVLTVVTAVLLLATAARAEAQTLRLGPKAGLNLGWFSGSDWKDFIDAADSIPGISASNDVNVGFFGGGFLEIGVSPTFALQIELLIGTVSGGLTVDDDFSSDKIELSQRATVLSFPLLLKPKFDVGDSGSIYGLIGPEPGFILGDLKLKEKVTGFGTDTVDVSPDNSFVFSATLGAGYEHRVAGGAVNAEIRYNRTFTSVFDDDNTRINSINFFVGYGFDL